MDFLRDALSSKPAPLAIAVLLLLGAFALGLRGVSVALTVLLAVVGVVFLVVWFVQSRLDS